LLSFGDRGHLGSRRPAADQSLLGLWIEEVQVMRIDGGLDGLPGLDIITAWIHPRGQRLATNVEVDKDLAAHALDDLDFAIDLRQPVTAWEANILDVLGPNAHDDLLATRGTGIREESFFDRDLEALKPLSIQVASKDLQLWLTPEEANSADQLLDQLGVQRSQLIVILQPGARYWFKAWPPERFAELADHLASQYGCQVLIGGSDQDIDLAQQIQQMAKSRPIIMAGRTTIKQFAAIAKKSALFVGSDSGAMHIASAAGTPVVALFGPSSPREWGPRGGPAEVLYKDLDCRSCFHPTCTRGEENCMRLITIDEVMMAAAGLMGQARLAIQ